MDTRRVDLRSTLVRSYFDQPDKYLYLHYYVDVKAQVLRELCGIIKEASILDVGCGNGIMSKQYYAQGRNHLTLLDVSANMLALAKENFASENSADGYATFIHGDLDCLTAAPAFDYILALGVLAHVPTPELFSAKLASLLKPGGRLLLQLTDYETFLGALRWHHQKIRDSILRCRGYRMNKLKVTQIQSHLSSHGLVTEAIVRYSINFPGMDRILPDRMMFKYENWVRKNKMLSRWGSEAMMMFYKE
jgi:ubiquinone/menaquinone biosynthesis C-methylase UbiE